LVSCGASCTYFTCGEKEMVTHFHAFSILSCHHFVTDRGIHVRNPCKDW
jgi:hypothetical protein